MLQTSFMLINFYLKYKNIQEEETEVKSKKRENAAAELAKYKHYFKLECGVQQLVQLKKRPSG